MELTLLANVLLFIGPFAPDFINGRGKDTVDDTADDTGDDNPTDDFAQSGSTLNDTVSAQNKKPNSPMAQVMIWLMARRGMIRSGRTGGWHNFWRRRR
jgi:hypothetical protein